MNEAVASGALGLAISMGGVVILATAAGMLASWLELHSDHADAGH